jgi:four helix bundle protein
MHNVTKYDLEDRLVRFACMCLKICQLLPNTKAGSNLEYQLSKSSTAIALVYGEAQATESRTDFVHKVKIVLKEIRETRVNLKIIREMPLVTEDILEKTFCESNELMAIFLQSIKTAQKNNIKSKLKM